MGAPTACARSIAPSIALRDRSEPSVGTRMCLNMMPSVAGCAQRGVSAKRSAADEPLQSIVVRGNAHTRWVQGLFAYRKPLRGYARRATRRPASAPVIGMAVCMLEKIQKQPDPQRQMATLRKHRVDADRRGGGFVEHDHEASGGGVRSDPPPRTPPEPMAFEAPVVQPRAVRAFHRAGHLDRHHLVALLEHPAALLIGART